jgi:DNA helicase-4
MRLLLKQIELKKSEKIKYVNYKEKLLSDIKELEKNLTTYQKSFFEKIIGIITLGFISYTEKYLALTNENQRYILESNKKLIEIDNKLILIETEISRVENELENKINQFKSILLSFQQKLQQFADNRYINDFSRIKLTVILTKIIQNKEEFLLHTEIKNFIIDIILFNQDSKKWIDNKNKIFIENEKKRKKVFFDTVESNPLTNRQQDAVLVNENNNLILAGAGSGKTSVIVAKVLYLINEKILNPNEILVLAFNKNAQEELKERFEKKDIHINVRTFHSFGLSVIAQATSKKPNLSPMVESQNNMTKFIKDTIRKLMASNKLFLEDFLNFIAYFNIPYKSESEFNSLGEYYNHQKNYDMKTLKHEVVTKGEIQGKTFMPFFRTEKQTLPS